MLDFTNLGFARVAVTLSFVAVDGWRGKGCLASDKCLGIRWPKAQRAAAIIRRSAEPGFDKTAVVFNKSRLVSPAGRVMGYGKGVVPWRGAPSAVEICVGIRGNFRSLITRQAAGIFDQTATRRDTVWPCPAGWQEGSIEFADDLLEVMHIYLPASQFSPSKLGVDVDVLALGALRYESAFRDPLLGETARAIASELQDETSAGRLLIESLANSMAARLVQKHVTTSAAQSVAYLPGGGLDRLRLFRVLDYIEANLEGDLTLDHGFDCVSEPIPLCASVQASRRATSSSLRQRQTP